MSVLPTGEVLTALRKVLTVSFLFSSTVSAVSTVKAILYYRERVFGTRTNALQPVHLAVLVLDSFGSRGSRGRGSRNNCATINTIVHYS